MKNVMDLAKPHSLGELFQSLRVTESFIIFCVRSGVKNLLAGLNNVQNITSFARLHSCYFTLRKPSLVTSSLKPASLKSQGQLYIRSQTWYAR